MPVVTVVYQIKKNSFVYSSVDSMTVTMSNNCYSPFMNDGTLYVSFSGR